MPPPNDPIPDESARMAHSPSSGIEQGARGVQFDLTYWDRKPECEKSVDQDERHKVSQVCQMSQTMTPDFRAPPPAGALRTDTRTTTRATDKPDQ
jgi:hypothetical protein